MKRETTAAKSRDILSNPLLAFALFCLPVIAIIASGHPGVGKNWRTAIWTAALSAKRNDADTIQKRNNRHSQKRRALSSSSAPACIEPHWLCARSPLRANGWNVISLTVLVGAIALGCLPELFFGKYRKDRTNNADRP
jgi:hypothetical protein